MSECKAIKCECFECRYKDFCLEYISNSQLYEQVSDAFLIKCRKELSCYSCGKFYYKTKTTKCDSCDTISCENCNKTLKCGNCDILVCIKCCDKLYCSYCDKTYCKNCEIHYEMCCDSGNSGKND